MDEVNERTHGPGTWLSLEASLEQVRHLRAWSSRQQDAVHSAFQDAYGAWCDAWGLPVADVRVTGPEGASGTLDDASAVQALRVWMFGEAAASAAPDGPDMAGDLALRAWDALHVALDAIVPIKGGACQPAAPWSGALALALPWQGRTWRRVLDGAAVEALLAQRGMLAEPTGPQAQSVAAPSPLSPVDQALADHPVKVHVHLHPVTLTLGQLQSLSLGDVVTLDHMLQAPAFVHFGHSVHGGAAASLASPLCTAWLGRAGNRLAVEVHAKP